MHAKKLCHLQKYAFENLLQAHLDVSRLAMVPNKVEKALSAPANWPRANQRLSSPAIPSNPLIIRQSCMGSIELERDNFQLN